jgi:hypothetical protein
VRQSFVFAALRRDESLCGARAEPLVDVVCGQAGREIVDDPQGLRALHESATHYRVDIFT